MALDEGKDLRNFFMRSLRRNISEAALSDMTCGNHDLGSLDLAKKPFSSSSLTKGMCEDTPSL